MGIEDKIQVTVWCLTYNHQEFIRDALEGFVNQITNFKYKVAVYDDASTDGTTDIILEYKEKYPNLFDVTIADNNRYSEGCLGKYLYEWRKQKIEGKYTAICEGDDCWIDRYKLQRQFNFMESHKMYSLIMHNAVWMDYEKNNIISQMIFTSDLIGQDKTPEDIIIQKKAHPPTASFFLKNEIWKLPDFFYKDVVWDYQVQLAALSIGKIYCDSRYMSIYRCCTPGSHGQRIRDNKKFSANTWINLITFLFNYNEYTNYKFSKYVEGAITKFAISFLEAIGQKENLQTYIYREWNRGNLIEVPNDVMINKLQELCDLIYDTEFIPKRIREYIERNESISIMGAGKYSRILGRKLIDNNIYFDAYVVSDLINNPENIDGKCVKLVSEKNCDGILIGILPIEVNSIIDSLKKNSINNYLFAYSI